MYKHPVCLRLPHWKALCKDWSLMSQKTLVEVAEQMAEAIREWNRAKREREEWRPVPGMVPPDKYLNNAKKANVLLTQALEEYEAFQQSFAVDGFDSEPKCMCPADGLWAGCPVHGTRRH